MRLNGWQRLWLLASLLWAVVILALAGILQSGGDQLSVLRRRSCDVHTSFARGWSGTCRKTSVNTGSMSTACGGRSSR